jgi:hypothetical protein
MCPGAFLAGTSVEKVSFQARALVGRGNQGEIFWSQNTVGRFIVRA